MRTTNTLVAAVLLATACGRDDAGTDTVADMNEGDATATSDATATGDTTTSDTTTSSTTASSEASDVADDCDTTTETGTGGEVCMVEGGPMGGSGNACKDAGGVCLTVEADCAAQGGTRAEAGDADCTGFCCVPPPPSAIDGVCAHAGGLCTDLSSCAAVDGKHGPSSECFCKGDGITCCVPEWQCGPTTLICCDMGLASFHPTCSCGTYDCSNVPGTVLVEPSECRWGSTPE